MGITGERSREDPLRDVHRPVPAATGRSSARPAGLPDFTDYDTRLAAYAVIVDEHDRILLTWYIGGEHSPACWSMPGGGVEFDESLQQAVAREVLEETGYTVEVGGPIAVHHFTKPNTGRDGRPYKSVRVIFAAAVTGGSLGTIEVDGTTAFAQWVPLDQAPSLSPRADIIDVALAERRKDGVI